MKKEEKKDRRTKRNTPSLFTYFEQQAVRRFLEKEAVDVAEVTREWVRDYII